MQLIIVLQLFRLKIIAGVHGSALKVRTRRGEFYD